MRYHGLGVSDPITEKNPSVVLKRVFSGKAQPGQEEIAARVRSILHGKLSVFDRLVFVASLRTPEGRREFCLHHFGGECRQDDVVETVAAARHRQVFLYWLSMSLLEKTADVSEYCGLQGWSFAGALRPWSTQAAQDQLVPDGANRPEREQFR